VKIYQDKYRRNISFPLGGIGTGCIGLSGTGRLIDWEIFNRPNKLSYNGMSHFAVKAERGGKVLDVRVLNGPYLGDRSGSPKTFGFGPPRETMAGVPHFRECEFRGEFPFAELVFTDPKFPGRVILSAFNPLIPLNSLDSSIPAAMFTIRFENLTEQDIDYSVFLTVANPGKIKSHNVFAKEQEWRMLHLRNLGIAPEDADYGDICLATDSPDVSYQENWFRGSWFDSLGVYWRELNTPGRLTNRSYGIIDDATLPGGITDATAHAVLAVHLSCSAGQSVLTRMAISWNIPYCHNYWDKKVNDEDLRKQRLPKYWKNFYATQWSNAMGSAAYVLHCWSRLEQETRAFAAALYNSTLPDPFIDAIGANLCILKSPTCLRLEDGSFYAFEGCTTDSGCCEGSCTHVWTYAYALAFLFPDLERSIRELEYSFNLGENGEIPMRLMLPLGRQSPYRACADGQFGTIIKVYREWKRSGDDKWLKKLWPGVKRSLEYAWHPGNEDRWDPEQCGILTGRQHHTLDMELFGPNSWLSGFYLAALKAAAEMALAMGETVNAELYTNIYEKGRKTLNTELFNGEYFQQHLCLNDRNILAPYSASSGCANKDHHETIYDAYWDKEHSEIKYQIGDGCEIDQIIGQWHAWLCGLGEIFDRDKAVSALRAIFRHNYKPVLAEHFNPCRLYGLEDESGTVMCEWPTGCYKPWVPLTYAEETMHGFEYALAGQMVQYGMMDEAVLIVKAVRDRYDGDRRNPWNEMECGSNYARSLASFAFIPAFSGFKCDMTKGELEFNPVGIGKGFKSFWSVASAWGKIEATGNSVVLKVLYGELTLSMINLPFIKVQCICNPENQRVIIDGTGKIVFPDGIKLCRDEELVITTTANNQEIGFGKMVCEAAR